MHSSFFVSLLTDLPSSVGPTKLSRTSIDYILGASLEITSYDAPQNPKFLTGLPSKLTTLEPVHPTRGSDSTGPFSEIHIPQFFPPGSILLFLTQIEGISASLDTFVKSDVEKAFSGLDLVDLNVILHRADGEERDATTGEIGCYDVPGHGTLVYAGLEGWMAPLRKVMLENDLGHPICGHLRSGVWAMDYIVMRLERCVYPFIHFSAWF